MNTQPRLVEYGTLYERALLITFLVSLFFGGFLLFIPTIAVGIWLGLKMAFRRKVYVMNQETKEKFFVSKSEWKIYRKQLKKRNSKIKSINEIW